MPTLPDLPDTWMEKIDVTLDALAPLYGGCDNAAAKAIVEQVTGETFTFIHLPGKTFRVGCRSYLAETSYQIVLEIDCDGIWLDYCREPAETILGKVASGF